VTVFEDAFNKTMNTDNQVCPACCLVITTWWGLRPMVNSISDIIKPAYLTLLLGLNHYEAGLYK